MIRRCVKLLWSPPGVYTGEKLRTRAISLVVLHEHFTCFLVEGRFRIGVDQEAFNGHKDVSDAVCRLPILLESVHTDFACGADIGMEDLGGKPT